MSLSVGWPIWREVASEGVQLDSQYILAGYNFKVCLSISICHKKKVCKEYVCSSRKRWLADSRSNSQGKHSILLGSY